MPRLTRKQIEEALAEAKATIDGLKHWTAPDGDMFDLTDPDVVLALIGGCMERDRLKARIATLEAEVERLREAVVFTKQFLQRLEGGDTADPLYEIRVKFHAPLHAKLDAALSPTTQAACDVPKQAETVVSWEATEEIMRRMRMAADLAALEGEK